MNPTVPALCLAAGVSLCGCATKPAVLPAPAATVWVEGPVAAGSPMIAPLILADDGAIELLGAELTPEARARFNEARSTRIAHRSTVNANPAEIPLGCLRLAIDPRLLGMGILACPFLAVGYVAVVGTAKGVKHLNASLREPGLAIPEKDANRIAAALKEHATGAALAERAMRFTASSEFAGTEEPQTRLIVRIKSAEMANLRVSPRLVMVVEAQAVGPDGVALPPTEHSCTYGPLPDRNPDDEALRRALDEAFDALARSIASTYLRTWKLTESAAEKPPAERADTDAGTALLSANPSLPPRAGLSLPVAGDTWTYRVSYRQRGGPKNSTHQVTITRVMPDAIVEQLASEQGEATQTEHRKGGHLVRQGEASLFSPYFIAFDSAAPGTRISRIENLDGRICGDARWVCSVVGRVVGKEIVRVPAGEFEAIKVEVEQSWMPRTGAQAGARTLTTWYSPQTKRALKVSSRGTHNVHIESEFDLELVAYELN